MFPKPSGLNWTENINVSSLVFRHSDESSDFNLLKGSINVYASSNQVYYFENINLDGDNDYSLKIPHNVDSTVYTMCN